ncbi:hypothetical protein DN068_06350 [Taibaiella soli]|uniref:Uncharacterized protein n=2 Tax=Taibaiella soli TaxID=1649169 RepID=A0A2W2BDK9_9BACT|nr:hypothetical protein DN068_06350 [Taibaiella soli]
MLLVLQVFILTAHADDVDEDEFAIEQGITVISSQNHHGAFMMDQSIIHQQKKTQILPEHRSKRYQVGKHISVQSVVTKAPDINFHSFYESIVHTPSVPKNYRYTFFREINPPPPKFC